ncbi:MAG: hypothetical protein WBM11_07495 [Terriglobales bacterium]
MGRFGIQELAKTVSKWRNSPGCANAACEGSPLKHAVSKRHFGVWLAEEWFCSPECFEKGARKKIVELLSSRHRQEKPPALRMPLGLLLVSREILTHEQLKVALEQQRAKGINLGETVQELGFATEQQVTSAVAAQWACPVFTFGDRPLPAEVRVPRRVLEQYGMLPVHYSAIGKRLMVGFVSRVQHHILYTIEHITSCSASPCFITASEYRRGMQLCNLTATENEIVFDRASSTAEIAGLARNYVNQIGAERTRFGMCRDYLWVRVTGRQEIDLLFRLQEH